ncbi:MAG: hypothetical protein R3207_09940, partial [Oceanospirillum sp.]|nr:hypothetical protein [Oceanospirillum sp.]
MTESNNSQNVDFSEVAKFEALASRWWDPLSFLHFSFVVVATLLFEYFFRLFFFCGYFCFKKRKKL